MRRALLALSLCLLARSARAQRLEVGAFLEGGSGVEIGGGQGFVLAHRARTTLSAGALLRSSELRGEAVVVTVTAEVEPTLSLGGSVAWSHALGPLFSVRAGVAGVIAPHSLFGPVVGARATLKLGRLGLLVGPDLKGFVLGGDLPKSSVIVVGLVMVGVHADL